MNAPSLIFSGDFILIKTIYTIKKEDRLFNFYAGLHTKYEDEVKSGKYAITINPEKKEVTIMGDEERKNWSVKLKEKAGIKLLAAAGIKVRDEKLSEDEFNQTISEIKAKAAEFESNSKLSNTAMQTVSGS